MIGAAPARVREILIYPEFLDMEAQDPEIHEHIDDYEWRATGVSGPDPVLLTGPQEDVEASLFPTTAVRWRDIPRSYGTSKGAHATLARFGSRGRARRI